MQKNYFWELILFLFYLLINNSCYDKFPSHAIKELDKNTNNEFEEPKEESYDYFIYKNLIEEFPFTKSNYSNFYREYLKSKIIRYNKNQFRSLPNWESIGPGNIAGRTLCLAINPIDTNQLWMGSAGSGLWKSNKGGAGANAWQYISTGFPVISISSIAMQIDQPDIMYIGTGEIYNYQGSDGGIITRTLRGSNGIGILKSIDGGIHWNLSLDWSSNNQSAIWKIIIHPINPNIVYAATNLGIYKTIDGGANWFTVLDLPLAMDLIIDKQQPNVLCAGVGGINGTHYGIYKTSDDGANWNLVHTPNDSIYNGRIMLTNYKANPKRVIAAFSDAYKTIAMMRSREGFDTFNFFLPIKDVCEHQGWYAKCLQIKDDDSSKIIMGGVDLYLDTTGTGNQLFNLLNWKIRIHADLHDIISNPLDPNKLYIATDGGLYRSNDFARTFTSCNQGYLSSQFYTGNISTHSSQLLGGLQDNRSAIFKQSNQWINIHQADGTFNAFHPQNDSIIYISSQYQNLYVSNDFGSTWKELVKINLSASFVSPFLIQTKNPLKLYSGGNQLLHSNDGGISWDSCYLISHEESIVAMEQNASNEDQIYISSLNLTSKESHLYYSSDGGIHLQLKENGIPERFIRDIAIDLNNTNTLYIALGGTGQAGIMKSEDAAASWFFPPNINLPDVPFHSILVDPKDHDIIYAGCDFGLYVSFDQGLNWMSYNLHPYDLVAVYDIKYSSFENKLILFTHGFGAFRCSLLDKSVITKTENINHADRLVHILNDFIVLPERLNYNGSLQLIDLEGKQFCLKKNSNGYSAKDLDSGLYFVILNNESFHGLKMMVIH